MRQIKDAERQIIDALSKAAGLSIVPASEQEVWVVNPYMGSIRSSSCPKGRRVKSVASCEYSDADGTPIFVTLLLAEDGTFGELDFWKVTDQPIVGDLPAVTALKNLTSSKEALERFLKENPPT